MKTPHYSSAHQILRLGFKLWLDLALEGKACRGSSSLSYDIIHQSGWKCSRWWPPWPSQQHRAMTESLSIMQVPVCLSEVPQCSSSYWVAPAAVQKKSYCFPFLVWKKRSFFFNIIINLRNGPDALMFVLSRERSSRVAWERTTSPRTSAKRDWRFVVWDGLWSGTSSFLSLGAESVARKRRNKSSCFFKTEFGTIQGVFQDVKRPEMLESGSLTSKALKMHNLSVGPDCQLWSGRIIQSNLI